MSFSDDQKYIVRGVTKTFATKGGTEVREETAGLIHQALLRIFGEWWSIVMYRSASFEAEIGYGDYVNFEDKWWIYGRRTSKADRGYKQAEVSEFLQTMFGWSKVANAAGFRKAVELQVNARFPGNWKVHLAKFKPGLSGSCCWSISGASFLHDGYHLWVMESE
jgi:hypothetical protein